ncbi:MAG: hypothetical protein FJ225_08945 [Lentisphaerae bacterium]|nr:hypothetical protein [Lentisphaerota bacterium]
MTMTAETATAAERSFGEDVAFLAGHQDVHVLKSADGQARVALVAAYQGRVMTSTAGGETGDSYGWINYEHVASGKPVPHINVYGGEDRFWLGPEGGQFAIFFKAGDKFNLDDWQTPAVIDSVTYDVKAKSDTSATFTKKAGVTNYSGARFDLAIERTVSLLDAAAVEKALGVGAGEGVKTVAYESVNKLTNAGRQAWDKKTGLLSIWILGMYKPGERTTVVIPFKAGGDELGTRIVDDYFGKVPGDRLIVKDAAAYFRADGKYRSKIGVPPRRAKPVVGSYDALNKVLTLVQYTLPEGVTDYVNSQWAPQDKPFAGDTVNSYNDGPPAPGAKPLGPFYELETSSPALALKPGETATHVHRTFHFQGDEAALDPIARATLGAGLEEIKAAFQAGE